MDARQIVDTDAIAEHEWIGFSSIYQYLLFFCQVRRYCTLYTNTRMLSLSNKVYCLDTTYYNNNMINFPIYSLMTSCGEVVQTIATEISRNTTIANYKNKSQRKNV